MKNRFMKCISLILIITVMLCGITRVNVFADTYVSSGTTGDCYWEIVKNNLGKMLYRHPDFKKIIGATKNNQVTQRLKRELRGKEKAIKNIFNTSEVGCDDELLNRLKKLKAEKNDIQEKLNNMKIKDPKTICKKFKNILIYSEASEVKEFLKQAINSIVVDHDEVKININEF